jgi:hypothetical protein
VPQVPGPIPISSATLLLILMILLFLVLMGKLFLGDADGDGDRDGSAALKKRMQMTKLEGWRRLPPYLPYCIMAMAVYMLCLVGYYMAGQWETQHVAMDARLDYGVMQAAYPKAYFNQLNATAAEGDAGLGALVSFQNDMRQRAAHWETYWFLQLCAVVAGTVLLLSMMYVNKSLSEFQRVMLHNSMDIFMVLQSILITAVGLAFLMLLTNNQDFKVTPTLVGISTLILDPGPLIDSTGDRGHFDNSTVPVYTLFMVVLFMPLYALLTAVLVEGLNNGTRVERQGFRDPFMRKHIPEQLFWLLRYEAMKHLPELAEMVNSGCVADTRVASPAPSLSRSLSMGLTAIPAAPRVLRNAVGSVRAIAAFKIGSR